MSDADIDDLRKQSQNTDRVSAATDDQQTLEDALVEHFTGVKDGTESGQVAIRDDRLTALANTMVERDAEMDEFVQQLTAELDAQPNVQTDTKAGLFALLARIGLQEAAPEYHEMLQDAVAEYAQRRL